MNKTRISCVIITYNEECDIERALKSIDWCDEKIVVDSGSTDRTVEICRQYGCKAFYREFSGFGEQKQFAVDQASHDWILSIDADEVVPVEVREEILANLNTDQPEVQGFYLPICTVLWDGKIRQSSRYIRPKIRLFNRNFGQFRLVKVHEGVKVTGKTMLLKQPMYNFGYANVADYFQKFNSYTSFAASDSFERKKNASVVVMILRFPIQFLKMYFIQRFFLDGSAGLLWALFSSFYPLVKYSKLRELYDKNFETSPKRQINDRSFDGGIVPADAKGEESTVRA